MSKRTVLIFAVSIFALSLVASASAPTSPTIEEPVLTVELTQAEVPALVADQCGSDTLIFQARGPIPNCGDSCTGNIGRGCRQYVGGHARKVPCSCINGVFVCE